MLLIYCIHMLVKVFIFQHKKTQRKDKAMTISKVNTKFKIIRKPDYSRKDSESSIKVEVSNRDSALNNNQFNDLIFKSEENKKDKKPKKKVTPVEKQKDSNPSDINEIRSVTDFYI